MRKIFISFFLFFILNTVVLANKTNIQATDKATSRTVIPCKELLKMNDAEFRLKIINGVGNCYGRSARANRYTCTLFEKGDWPRVHEYDDFSCMNLFVTIRELISSGKYEKMCGKCELNTFPLK